MNCYLKLKPWGMLALVLLPLDVFAVKVANCPSQLAARFSDFEISINENELADAINDFEPIPEQENAVRESYRRLLALGSIEKKYSIHTRFGGKCIYGNKEKSEYIELYTERKKDTLLFSTVLGPRGIVLRAYSSLETYAPNAIKADASSKVYIGIPRWPYQTYREGGHLFRIAKATQKLK